MKPLRLAHITDLHLDEEFDGIEIDARRNLIAMLDDIAEKQIQDLVITGDLGTPASHQWLANVLRAYKLRFALTLGNHDKYAEVSRHFDLQKPGSDMEHFYSYQSGSSNFIFLDTSSARISTEQSNWLTDELQIGMRSIVFLHHPILDTGATPQLEYPLHGSEALANLIHHSGQEVYLFCGHLHITDEQKVHKITQWVTPAGCLQVKRESPTTEILNTSYGYRIIELSDQKVESSVRVFPASIS